MVVKAWEQEQKKGWLHWIHNQEADSEQVEPGYKNLRQYCPSNLLPPVWLHLLKISGLFLVTSRTGDQACQHMSLWGTPYAQTTTVYRCCFDAKHSRFLKLKFSPLRVHATALRFGLLLVINLMPNLSFIIMS